MALTQLKPLKEPSKTIDTARYLDDVVLSGSLLENAAKNDGVLSASDIVFSLRNLSRIRCMQAVQFSGFQKTQSGQKAINAKGGGR